MTVEYKDGGKTGCTECPKCGTEIGPQQSLAKHIRTGDCSGVSW